MEPSDLYNQAGVLSLALEQELKRLNRWDDKPLSVEKFEDMGAFGSNTMAFEQWLQFVLIPRIQDIIKEQGEFPDESMLAPYAIRHFDGDPDADGIHDILYQLDDLINGIDQTAPEPASEQTGMNKTVTLGSDQIPDVLFTLAEILPQHNFEDLESQLQTFDTFLDILSPAVRPTLAGMIRKASLEAEDPLCKQRMEQAATDIEKGGRASSLTY